jgi:glycosyltransferase involved in cell wall biosynthesis
MGAKQGLDSVLEAARRTPSAEKFKFVFLGDGNQRVNLERLARPLSNVVLMDQADSDTFPSILAAADALLVNERPSVLDMSLPSKLTSYWTSGVPVVAATSDLGATGHEIRRSGAGLVVSPGDPDELLIGLRRLREDKGLGVELAKRGRQYIEDNLRSEDGLAAIGDVLQTVVANHRH